MKRNYTYLNKFCACFEQYRERDGEEFEVLGIIPANSKDNETEEDMFRIRFKKDGKVTSAWMDEVVATVNRRRLKVLVGGTVRRYGKDVR